MIDMSAAFDVVDTDILLEKLKLYGFDRNTIQWIWSYLTYRSQEVYVEGSLSGATSFVQHLECTTSDVQHLGCTTNEYTTP